MFAGYGLSAPDAGHDDLTGLDLAGKVVVYIAGTPGTITGALAAHYQLSADVANRPARPRWKPGTFFKRFETQ